jgi:hypothetical protein
MLEHVSRVIYEYLSYNVTFLEEGDVDVKIQNFENTLMHYVSHY